MPVSKLAKQQADFIATINGGPNLLNPDLFLGPIDRVLLGLKAHANTISHARLVALEETFPMTRSAMGDARFNELCREYCETDYARSASNNHIGARFADFLNQSAVPASTADLCRIEWAWLESYHAPDAEALSMADIGGLDEAVMLNMAIAPHPSARLTRLRAPLSSELAALEASDNTAAILTVRPQSQVQFLALDALCADVFTLANKQGRLGNLLSFALEQAEGETQLEPILKLIGAGAFMIRA